MLFNGSLYEIGQDFLGMQYKHIFYGGEYDFLSKLFPELKRICSVSRNCLVRFELVTRCVNI